MASLSHQFRIRVEHRYDNDLYHETVKPWTLRTEWTEHLKDANVCLQRWCESLKGTRCVPVLEVRETPVGYGEGI